MQEMSVFWLRAAAVLYAIGFLHTIQVAMRKGRSIFRAALGSFCIGVVLHLVAIVEASKAANHFPPQGFHNSVSLCALLVAILFLFLYSKYGFESLGVFLFPMVFVMTAIASLRAPIGQWSDPETRTTLLMVGVTQRDQGCSAPAASTGPNGPSTSSKRGRRPSALRSAAWSRH